MPVVGRLVENDLLIAGEVNERLPAVCKTTTIEIRSAGIGGPADISVYTNIDGVRRADYTRGIILVRLNEWGDFVDTTSYDTHGGLGSYQAEESDRLADFITNTPDGYTLIFTTYDDPSSSGNAKLYPVLKKLGFRYLNWNYRSAWAGIIQKGTGSAIFEDYRSGETADTGIYFKTTIPKGIIHFPFDDTAVSIQGLKPLYYCPKKIRYIRDWINGSTANGGNHWVQIQAFDFRGNNVAKGKPMIETSPVAHLTQHLFSMTDGTTDCAKYFELLADGAPKYITVDMLTVYDVRKLKIFHYWGDGRSYYNTKTEVSDNGRDWYPVFDSAIDGIYAETSTGHDIELFTNHRLTQNGIAVDDSTTNIYNLDAGISVYNNYGVPASIEVIKEKYMDQPIYRVSMTPTESSVNGFRTERWSHGIHSSVHTFKANTAYAFSIYWRCLNKDDVVVSVYASNIARWYDLYTEDVGDGWKRTCGYRTGDDPAERYDAIYTSFFSPSAQVGEPIIIDWTCMQLEEGREYSTAFIRGSKSSGSWSGFNGIGLPWPKTFPFSVSFRANLLTKGGRFASEGSERNIIYMGSLWKYIGDNYCGHICQIARADMPPYQDDCQITFVYKNTSQVDVYINNVKWGSNQGYYQPDKLTQIPYWTLGARGYEPYLSCANAIFRDVTIYNWGLSADEINKLSQRRFSLTSEGNIFNTEIMEKFAYIPKNAYYFPLSDNLKDQYYHKDADNPDGSNVLFEGGKAFVGKAMTNYVSTPLDFSAWDAKENVTLTFNQIDPFGGKKAVRVHPHSSIDSYFGCRQNRLFPGRFTCSIWLKATKPCSVPLIIGNNSAGQAIIQQLQLTTQWKEYIVTGDIATQPAGNTLHIGGWSTWTDISFDIFVAFPMVVNLPFKPPFFVGDRGYGKLHYNLHRDLGLDWNGDWSIVYKKYPMFGHDYTYTGYNIDSLGGEGAGYFYWGKEFNGDHMVAHDNTMGTFGFTNGAINRDYYYSGRPVIMGIIKSGSTITVNAYFMNGQKAFASKTLGTVPANHYVNNWGHDLKLGGWWLEGLCYTFYQDLIVCKYALTDAEFDKMCRTQMQEVKDKLIINGNIKEKMNL